MSTRKLIFLALLCGLALIVAFGAQLVLDQVELSPVGPVDRQL